MRLTDFQEVMRQWARFWPYCAVDVMHLSGNADSCRWEEAIAAVLDQCGLPQPVNLLRYPGLSSAAGSELNKLFGPDSDPFRFFLIEPADEGAGYSIGMAWNHWIADSESIRQLMRRFLAKYIGETGLPRLRRASPPAGASLLAAMRAALQIRIRHRRAMRPSLLNPLDFESGVDHRVVPGLSASSLHQVAREWGVTVNDLFLASLVRTIGPWVMECSEDHPRRRDIGIGVAADTRRYFPGVSDSDFGFFLSYFSVVLSTDAAGLAMEDLARKIAKETRKLRAPGGPVHLDAGFRALRVAWSLLARPKSRATLVYQAAQCCAGLSTVNLSGSWASDAVSLLDYWRFSPAGPLVPIVFSPTSLDDRFSIAVTWRKTAFTEPLAQLWMESFIQRIKAIC